MNRAAQKVACQLAVLKVRPDQLINQNIDNIIRVFNPPINRIRRLGIKLKFHNGEYLFFAGETFSFTLKFNLFLPQNAKKYTMYKPESF